MKRLSLAIMLALMSISAMLAQRTVSGTVTDTKGEPLIGVSIFARGTSVGTVTDIDGTYSLNVPEGVNTLVFSYTGFETQEVSLGASNVIDVQMEEAVEQLSEVVVTGLGIRKEKKALGYGVTTLDQSALELRPEADVARVLRGKVPGVDITSTSGLAGSGTNVIIRGYSSITGTNQPLFVVDGVPFNSDTRADQGVLAGAASASSRFLDLDPNNIAEVSVLKGLSATVLYGEAGRNGVILITTKNGASRDLNKKFEVTVDQSFFANDIASLPDDQDSYGNGFWNTASAAFSNWGAPFDQPGKYGVAEDGTI
ncbi:MAG: SusC/RagA family TonB-linked outer membrane protein, partial [Bacteroidetes bacterium]